MQISEITVLRTAQYHETDSMKVVHHANYVKWMEEARLSFFKKVGFDWAKMERETGIMIPVLFQSVEYKNRILFDDTVLVVCKCEKFNAVKMNFSYEFYNEDKSMLYASGITKHGFIDKNFEPIRLDEEFNEGFCALATAIQ